MQLKLNFVVFIRNSTALLNFVEYLHYNPSHFSRFHCHSIDNFVVVFVYEGNDKVLEEAVRVGIVVIPQQEVKDNA
jgi:hypothetical protein